MTTTQTTTSKYAVCVNYKNNARLLDDSAQGEYARYFDNKRDAWNYAQTVGHHAAVKPYMTVDVTVVELVHYRHVYRNIWNAR